MRRIAVSDQFAIVDDDEFDMVSAHKWHLHNHSKYARASIKDINTGVRRSVLMHRLILPVSGIIDHINRDGLDNRKCNLRPATASENCRNRKSYGDSSSKFKGVYLHPTGRWQAAIKITCGDGIATYLGIFDDEIDAALAYNVAAKEHFGEFANLNIIDRTTYLIGPHQRVQTRGNTHHRSKLTEDDVLDIRCVYAFGGRIADIASAYQIGTSQTYRIATHQSWTHI